MRPVDNYRANSLVSLNEAAALQRRELKVRRASGKTRLPVDSLRSRDSLQRPVSQSAQAAKYRKSDREKWR